MKRTISVLLVILFSILTLVGCDQLPNFDISNEDLGLPCSHEYDKQVTAPTCTEDGFTVYTCAHCDDSYVADETEATGHSYTDGVCSVCGAEDPDANTPEPKPDPEPKPEPTYLTVYLYNTAGWETAYVYTWDADGNNSGNWPGVEMTLCEDGLFVGEIPEGNAGVIFNNGDGRQTADLAVPTDDKVVFNNGTNAWGTYPPVDEPVPEPTPVTVYVNNTAGWDTVYVYVWDSSYNNNGAWPGTEMTVDEDGLFVAEIPVGYQKVIFNNGSGTQTADLDVPVDDNVVFNNSTGAWGAYPPVDEPVPEPTSVKVYLNNIAGWESVYFYAWGPLGENAKWPGEQLSADEDGLYSVNVISTYTGMLFHNGSGTQTVDLVIPTDGNVVYNNYKGEWGAYPPVDEPAPEVTYVKVYLHDTAGWEKVYVHAWGPAGNLATWPGTELTLGEDGLYAAEIPDTYTGMLFHNGSGTQTKDLALPVDENVVYDNTADTWGVYAPVEIPEPEPEPTTVKVYVNNTAGWDTVYVYVWDSSYNNNGAWPGTEMTVDEDGLFVAEIPNEYGNVIFNNGSGVQSADLKLPADENIVYNNSTGAWGTYPPADEPVPEVTYVTVYVNDAAGWGTVYFYAWGPLGESAKWPGEQLSANEDGLYSVSVASTYTGILFHNCSGTQTSDLTAPSDDNVVYNNSTCEWGAYPSVDEPAPVTYTVTYINDGVTTTVTFEHGSFPTLEVPANRDGYLFKGWYDDDGNLVTELTNADVTLTAKWVPYNTSDGSSTVTPEVPLG